MCNIQAGGVGITLSASSDVAFVELPWRPGDVDQAEDRCYGRMDAPHSITSWFLVAAQTIEEKMAALIDSKREMVEAATSGRVMTTGTLIAGLVKALLEDEAA